MFGLFTILFLVSIVGLVVGLVKPELVLKLIRKDDNPSRKTVLKYFGGALLVSFIMMGIASPSDNADKEKQTVVEADEVIEEDEVAEEEVEEVYVYEITEVERNVLSKPYAELTDDEKVIMEKMAVDFDSIEEKDKEGVSLGLDRLEAERDEYDKVKQAEADAKAEEERLAKEKADAEEKARLEKEKAERYETGITWEDIARDKDGLLGSYVRLSGKIIQVIDGEDVIQCRLAVNDDYNKVVLVEIQKDRLDQNLLEDDRITIEGMSMGNMQYTTVMGDERSIPAILVENTRMQ